MKRFFSHNPAFFVLVIIAVIAMVVFNQFMTALVLICAAIFTLK